MFGAERARLTRELEDGTFARGDMATCLMNSTQCERDLLFVAAGYAVCKDVHVYTQLYQF
jgi:hypothetical protein